MTESKVVVDGVPLVFFHFHSLQLLGRGLFFLGNYPLNRSQKRFIYDPYIRDINASIARVRRVTKSFRSGFSSLPIGSFINLWRTGQLGFRLGT